MKVRVCGKSSIPFLNLYGLNFIYLSIHISIYIFYYLFIWISIYLEAVCHVSLMVWFRLNEIPESSAECRRVYNVCNIFRKELIARLKLQNYNPLISLQPGVTALIYLTLCVFCYGWKSKFIILKVYTIKNQNTKFSR